MKKLLTLTVLCLALLTAPASANYATNITAGGLLSGTNQERSAAGAGSLAINSRLTAAAQARANDMVARDYWSHSSPEGWHADHYTNAAGYRGTLVGENLAFGQETNSELIAHWMSSPGHRSVMLDGRFSEVGFATANSSNYQGTGPQTVIVGMYGKPPAPAPQPTTPPATVTPPEPTTTPPVVEKPTNNKQPKAVITTQPAASKSSKLWYAGIPIVLLLGAIPFWLYQRKFKKRKGGKLFWWNAKPRPYRLKGHRRGKK